LQHNPTFVSFVNNGLRLILKAHAEKKSTAERQNDFPPLEIPLRDFWDCPSGPQTGHNRGTRPQDGQ